MTVATILDRKGRDVFTLAPDTPIAEIVDLLCEKKIGVVLLAQDGKLSGILSERDIVGALASGGQDVLKQPASAYMTCDVICCAENETVVSVMQRMTAGHFRHMPVLDNGALIGLISIGDVVKHRIEQTEKEAADMRAYIAAG
ncbi:MAG: CBS domain-containing protein [Cohaesibacter sp.]|nr:CBS domain-containing protein [Cohaesibacter sp.]MCV6602357.1 CBS domain-containing protein [Cohaesibacter sp.]